ncbi:MAG: TetR/AcrR family transcriptional regulator [Acidobacteriota bacterium]
MEAIIEAADADDAAGRGGAAAATATPRALLDAAERLFAERGVRGASLRAITAEAGVNLAAANYHFGSKDALIRAVVARRLRPINRVRLARLDALEDAARAGTPMTLRDLLRAMFEPLLRMGLGGDPQQRTAMTLLIGRSHIVPDPTLRAVVYSEMRKTIPRFHQAFARLLPHLSFETMMWRIHFAVGTVIHTLTGGDMLMLITGGRCRSDDIDALFDVLLPFLEAGLTAPVDGGPDAP